MSQENGNRSNPNNRKQNRKRPSYNNDKLEWIRKFNPHNNSTWSRRKNYQWNHGSYSSLSNIYNKQSPDCQNHQSSGHNLYNSHRFEYRYGRNSGSGSYKNDKKRTFATRNKYKYTKVNVNSTLAFRDFEKNCPSLYNSTETINSVQDREVRNLSEHLTEAESNGTYPLIAYNHSETTTNSVEYNIEAPTSDYLLGNNTANSCNISKYNQSQDTSSIDKLGKISVVPLAVLKNPYSDTVINTVIKKELENESNFVQPTINKQNECPVPDNPESVSRKLLNKIMTMDKAGIKFIINNPVTKFDAALKHHANKRFHEEIRKQLKQINLQPSEEGKRDYFEPDEFIDLNNIPEAFLKGIQQTFEVSFSEEAGIQSTNLDSSSKSTEMPANETVAISEVNIIRTTNIVGSSTETSNKPKTDLMTRLKNFENLKSQIEKSPRKRSSPKCNTKYQRSESQSEIVIEVDGSSNTSDSADDSNSSEDSTTSFSSASTNSSEKEKKRKVVLEENVVSSFKTLILPSLPTRQQRRFEKKTKNGLVESLSYIYDICLSKISKKIILGNYEKRTLKRNLKSSDNEQALQFLIKNIKELFEQDKPGKRDVAIITENKEYVNPIKQLTAEKLSTQGIEIDKNDPTKPSPDNQEILLNISNEIQGVKSSKRGHPPVPAQDGNLPQEHINKAKVLSEDKTAQSAVEGAKNQPLSTESSNAFLGCDGNKIVEESIYLDSKNRREKYNKLSHCELQTHSTLDSLLPSSSQNDSMVSSLEANSELPESDFRRRVWKSPGEKKCIQPLSMQRKSSGTQTASDDNSTACILSVNNSIPNCTDLTSLSINEMDDGRIISLIQENKISDSVFNKLKEIDLKLMELHKRKMSIEEMILKLQKDKMAVDLTKMQLQHEKLLIINTFAAQSKLPKSMSLDSLNIKTETGSNPCAGIVSLPPSCGNKKRKASQARQPFSTPFSEKLKNRKKRCQRDILLEDTANSLCNVDENLTNRIRSSHPDEISENADDIFQITSRRTMKKASVRSLQQNETLASQSEVSNLLPSTSQTSQMSKSKNLQSSKNPCSVKENFEQMSPNVSSVAKVPNENENFEMMKNPDKNNDRVNMSSVPNGNYIGSKLPLTQLSTRGKFIIAASEDGHIYKFNLITRKLISKFSKHTETITQILIDSNNIIYSTSLDGYLKKTSLESFGLELQSINLQEPLQAIDLQWNTLYIGSRWGNVFTYNTKTRQISETLLCSVGSSIMMIKATKEGARRILIISSKGNQISIRDAASGLLLRTIELKAKNTINSMLQDNNILYLGSSKHEMYVYDFTTGAEINEFLCGNCIMAMVMYKNKFIFSGCYDGFIYVLDKETGCQIGRFPGSGNVILSMQIIGDKILTSSKDNNMQLTDIPKYILALVNKK